MNKYFGVWGTGYCIFVRHMSETSELPSLTSKAKNKIIDHALAPK